MSKSVKRIVASESKAADLRRTARDLDFRYRDANTDVLNSQIATDAEVLRIHEALEGIGAPLDARLARMVEMRYFGGLTDQEVAESLDLTTRTVQRDWGEKRAFCLARC